MGAALLKLERGPGIEFTAAQQSTMCTLYMCSSRPPM